MFILEWTKIQSPRPSVCQCVFPSVRTLYYARDFFLSNGFNKFNLSGFLRERRLKLRDKRIKVSLRMNKRFICIIIPISFI